MKLEVLKTISSCLSKMYCTSSIELFQLCVCHRELDKVKHLYAHMDISIEEMRSKPVVRRWSRRTSILYYYECHTEPRFFSGEGGGRLFEGVRLFQILSLRIGANSKWGA